MEPTFWLRLFLIASVWCLSEILCYNVHRIDNENDQPVNVEIDFDFNSDYGTKKFYENLQKKGVDINHLLKTTDPSNRDSSGADEAKRRMYFFFINNSDSFTGGNNETPLESWSVVWYIASFGGLIIFFLIVSCSEWCCRRAIRNNNQTCTTATSGVPSSPTVPDTPPPSYDQFAPPSYDSICLGRRERGEKSEYDIYVVPVHALGTIMENRETEDAPPSYYSASTGQNFQSNEASRVT